MTTFETPDADDLSDDVASLWQAFIDQQVSIVAQPEAERAHLSAVWHSRFAAERARGPFRIEIARVDGVAAGLCTASVKATEGAIGYLFVAERHQKAGIGAQLLDRAHAWMQHHGAEVVTLVVRAGNADAAEWYERQGYAPTYSVLHRVLPSR